MARNQRTYDNEYKAQAFNKYLKTKATPWKYQPLADRTSLVAQQVRIRQWAEQIRDCQNRPEGMDVEIHYFLR